eukprot:scaffold289861_cov30-Tisochrysis_lutea.AAC.1
MAGGSLTASSRSHTYSCGMGSYGNGFSGSSHHRVSSNPTGPLKKDGTPDMRFAGNRGGRR